MNSFTLDIKGTSPGNAELEDSRIITSPRLPSNIDEVGNAEIVTSALLNGQDSTSVVVMIALMTAQFESLSITPERLEPTNSVPLTEFPYFPKLPAELRVRIWKFSKPGPRIVKIQGMGKGEDSINIYKNMTKPPAPLFVCQESRVEYLKWYRQIAVAPSEEKDLDGEHSNNVPLSKRHYPSAVYFDHACDTLDIPSACLLANDVRKIIRRPDGEFYDAPALEKEGITSIRLDVTSLEPSVAHRCRDFMMLVMIPYYYQDIDTVTIYVTEVQPIFPLLLWYTNVLHNTNRILSKTQCRLYQNVPYDKHGNSAIPGMPVSAIGNVKLILDWA